MLALAVRHRTHVVAVATSWWGTSVTVAATVVAVMATVAIAVTIAVTIAIVVEPVVIHHDAPVDVDVVYVSGIHVHDRRVVAEVITNPEATDKAASEVPEAVVDPAVIADPMAPVPGVPEIDPRVEPPVTRGPE